MKTTTLLLIDIYQLIISPLVHALLGPSHCRYKTTCSQYAKESIQVHGALRGVIMSARRIASCNPWGPARA